MTNLPFLFRTAIRDSRRNRGKLVLFMSSIVLGIAALVAINSFNDNLQADVDRQALSLLGADLVVSGNQEAGGEVREMLDSLPGERASEVELFSMAFMPKSGETQFVRLRAVEGNFPFYGELVSEPQGAVAVYRKRPSALVDAGMMTNYGLQAGDSIRLGSRSFQIAGKLVKGMGSTGIQATIAPSVYIDQQYLKSTGLVQPGSLLDYNYYFKLPTGFPVDEWEDARKNTFRNASLRATTLKEQKENLSEAFDGLNSFLNLVALVSLLLGCIGVASSVFIYVKSKISSIAVFRCLGMKGSDAFLVYFLQISALGFLGVLSGAVLGSAVQLLLPAVLSDFLPFEVTTAISWPALGQGILIGLVITSLFALLPLVSVRKVSPLRTLRTSFEEDLDPVDPLKWVINAGIVLAVFSFLWVLTADWTTAAIFTGGLLVAFLLLYLVSRGIIWSIRRFFPRNWSFVLRQGLSNLFRPNNQTQTLLVSIGLGTAILTNLFIIQGLLLNNVSEMDAGNQPNIILYGIERDQTEGLKDLTRSFDMPVIQSVPIVTMSVTGWKGRSKKEWIADTTRTGRLWAAMREARVTFRDTLDRTETLLRGEVPQRVQSPNDSIFISVEEGWAEALKLDLGDEVVFNVQGAILKTYIGAIREIDFRSMLTRFFIVFPTGVLEQAPQFGVIVTKSPNNVTTSEYRRSVVQAYPNVSVVDLATILETLNNILDKVSYIIQFMAVFSILTGLIVLLSSLLLSKYQRIRESVLLRTIGASRFQILSINATEYALLGMLSAATGIFISMVSSYLLARFRFELEFQLNWWPVILIFFIVTVFTVVIGMLNTREVLSRPPLEVLREETG